MRMRISKTREKNREEYVGLVLGLVDSDVYGAQMRRRNKDSDVDTIIRIDVAPPIVEYLFDGIRYFTGMGAKSDDIRLPIWAATNVALSV